MTTFGIARSYNEVDIIEWSMRRMVRQVDHIIIGDNSNDGTEDILHDLAKELPLTVVYEDGAIYDQCEVMTDFAIRALRAGADWGVFFDIDEAWAAREGTLSEQFARVPDYIMIAIARNLNHCATNRDDPTDPDPMHRMGWRSQAVLPLNKVACRLREDIQVAFGNHAATYMAEPYAASIEHIVQSRHYPYRSPEQFIKRVKHAWPQLRDSGLPETLGAHMRAYGLHLDEFGEEGLRRWFDNGMLAKDPETNPDLVFDPLPPLLIDEEDDE